MALTVTNLVTDVMEQLGVLGSGQMPSSAEATMVKAGYWSWLHTAQNRQIVDWYNDEDDIPDGAEHGVALCVCNQVYRKFGVERDPSWLMEGESALHDYMLNVVPAPPVEMVNM
jgi:hypothetical protein